MASTISEEEFLRLQNQLIELKTANYSLEEQYAQQVARNRQLSLRVEQLERECSKMSSCMNTSKKLKNTELMQQNEALQLKLQAQEDEFRLQNQTLLQELSALVTENEKLGGKLNSHGSEVELTLQVNEEVKKLQSQVSALKKALSEERLRSAHEISKLKDGLNIFMENMDEEIKNMMYEGGEYEICPYQEGVDSSSPVFLEEKKEEEEVKSPDAVLGLSDEHQSAKNELVRLTEHLDMMKQSHILESQTLAKELEDVKMTNKTLEDALCSLQQQLNYDKSASEKKNSELQSNLKLLQEEESNLRNCLFDEMCASKDGIISEYESKIRHLENEINLLECKYKIEVDHLLKVKSTLQDADESNCMKTERIRELEQQLVDLAAERSLNEKKGAVICRDLRRQLASERRRVEKIQEKLREVTDSSSLNKQDSSKGADADVTSVSSYSIMSGNLDPLESSSIVTGSLTNINGNEFSSQDENWLEVENKNLLERITILQEEKWVLEERINHLEQGSAAMAEDLMKKSELIQFYCMEGRPESQTSTSGIKSVKKISEILKLSELHEVNGRMHRLLEEMLTKNMHLQRDMEKMSREVETLRHALRAKEE